MFKNKIRKSLKNSFLDGAFFSVMFGAGDAYLNPYAIWMQLTPQQIGLLSSFPGLFSSVTQYKSPVIANILGRKKTILISVFLQAAMWVPIIATAFITGNKGFFFIFFVTLYSTFNALSGPAWASLMGQYIPSDKRGLYFSWRNKILGLITLLSTFFAGIILYFFKLGFFIIFSIAAVCRFISFFFLTKYYEPKTGNKKIVNRDNFFLYFKNFGNDDFVKFSVFVGLMSFAVYLSVPFFAVYMLRDLGFSYLKYMLITTSASATLLFTLSSWGKHADAIGNISVIKLSAMMISVLPALWIFSSSTGYLLIIQIFAGFAWGGFNLAVVNFIYDKSAKEKRISNFSFFNLINGLGIFAGSITGGFLIPNLPMISGNKILTLFLISAIVRFTASVLISNIKESKNIRTIGSFELFFSIIGIKPVIGVQQDTVRIE